MGFAQRIRVDVTTASDGTATGYSASLNGLIDKIEYVKAVSGGFSDGVDFTITDENTGQGLWTQNDINAQKHNVLEVLDSIDKDLIVTCGKEVYYRMCITALKDATTNPSERLYGYLIIGELIGVTSYMLNPELIM